MPTVFCLVLLDATPLVSSALALRLHRCTPWSLHLDDAHLTAITPTTRCSAALSSEGVRLDQGWLWASLHLRSDDGQQLSLAGLSRRDARQLQQLLEQARGDARRADRQAAMRAWIDAADALCDQTVQQRRWISHEQQLALLQQRQAIDPDQQGPSTPSSPIQAGTDATCAEDWQADWPALWEHANQHRQCRAGAQPCPVRTGGKPPLERGTGPRGDLL